ncbi:beta-L-arabinofuranosidase domain-containing protein [Demequina lutea]|uniref:DUF1680 family protein n=1 Tax=Demequina lutea TaxID=431489 RepID=A0A7Y9ZEF9_9MICO|nr:beta-L-arabinofuranosidase domain-containing protein [Demequina lutea]NYI42475.1 hypothetical protein [Demequina lutea]
MSDQRRTELDPSAVVLTHGRFHTGRNLVREYLFSLDNTALLQNYRIEAGLGSMPPLRTPIGGDPGMGDEWHWGWETPGTQMRGHFLGHWLSAASRFGAEGDHELAGKVEHILEGLHACQIANGGEWVFSIPVRYLERLAAHDQIWSPQYVMHKTLMGLVDAHRFLGSPLALEMATAASRWLHRWATGFSREEFDDILDVETGGMLEVWAELLDLTGDSMYFELLRLYRHDHLFDPLLDGKDVLTNRHANTTVPEVLGAARAYEVTGDPRWRDIVVAYWRSAVEERGSFSTGGQTTGEVWNPPLAYAARRGPRTQEHCTVYNMIRLASFLFRWTGESSYLDYIELNNLNGILAQQHPKTGMISYFLPLAGGSRKSWGRRTVDFWCCHGSLVQAHSSRSSDIFYARESEITVAQYISASASVVVGGQPVVITLNSSEDAGSGGPDDNVSVSTTWSRPNSWMINVRIAAPVATRFALRLRVPEWSDGLPVISVNGEVTSVALEDGFMTLDRSWGDDIVTLEIPKCIRVHHIPDEPHTVSFLDGPVVLAGLVDAEIALIGDPNAAEDLLVPENEREWSRWLGGFRAVGQPKTVSLIPLNQVIDESYSVYFPIVLR